MKLDNVSSKDMNVAKLKKLTQAEYEIYCRKASPIDLIDEVLREDPFYRATAIKELHARAKGAFISPMKWIYCELRNAIEKYEVQAKPLEEKPAEITEALNQPKPESLHEKNQATVQAPFFNDRNGVRH